MGQDPVIFGSYTFLVTKKLQGGMAMEIRNPAISLSSCWLIQVSRGMHRYNLLDPQRTYGACRGEIFKVNIGGYKILVRRKLGN